MTGLVKSRLKDEAWRDKWKNKEISAEDAIKKIIPGNRVFIDSGCSEPQLLTSTLIKHSEKLALRFRTLFSLCYTSPANGSGWLVPHKGCYELSKS